MLKVFSNYNIATASKILEWPQHLGHSWPFCGPGAKMLMGGKTREAQSPALFCLTSVRAIPLVKYFNFTSAYIWMYNHKGKAPQPLSSSTTQLQKSVLNLCRLRETSPRSTRGPARHANFLGRTASSVWYWSLFPLILSLARSHFWTNRSERKKVYFHCRIFIEWP